ncbi:MAG: DEAD/DEAH box helicase [Candidatus Altiarchaeota archaeon]|nr:DEAD/DEAH box helicase [Candidatus Altiarchaeota archaeon]
MRLDELSFGEKFKKILAAEGIQELYPPQEQALKAGIAEGESIILCTPTASGKTLASEFAIIHALEQGGKAVYVVPLKALAYEKYTDFKKYETMGFRVLMEIGDLDAKKYSHKPDYDIMVATAEKCDSIMRSRPDWFNSVTLLIFDEIHLIASDRGPVYEIIAAKARKLLPGIQVVGLSATIGNAGEVAGWLDAKLVESDWRPVQLREWAVVAADGINSIKKIVKDNASKGGQVLVFVNSRRSAEAVAEQLSELKLNPEKKEQLSELSEKILSALPNPTKQCERLALCAKGGSAFHHAGLVNSQRTAIEDAFRQGLIRVIAATPTLAAGVNLPARTVVIRDLHRFEADGLEKIPVLEYKQMAGRAGRPKYDKEGDSIAFAKSEDDREFVEEHYINGTVEDLHSLLGSEPVLRMHVLSSIASEFTKTEDSLLSFFATTFYGYQYRQGGRFEKEFRKTLAKTIKELSEWGLIETAERFLNATPLGRRVSELYIDPMTAKTYIDLFTKAEKQGKHGSLAYLEVLCDAAEMRPHLRVKKEDESTVWAEAFNLEEDLLRELDGFDLDFEFLNRFKTAKMFNHWINETTEQQILEDYNIPPGILNQKLQNLEWLAYAAGEITRLIKLRKTSILLSNLEMRVKHGIKEELIPLVGIKGIGRVRARKLYNAGIKTPADIKKADIISLKKLLGEKTAEKILNDPTLCE